MPRLPERPTVVIPLAESTLGMRYRPASSSTFVLVLSPPVYPTRPFTVVPVRMTAAPLVTISRAKPGDRVVSGRNAAVLVTIPPSRNHVPRLISASAVKFAVPVIVKVPGPSLCCEPLASVPVDLTSLLYVTTRAAALKSIEPLKVNKPLLVAFPKLLAVVIRNELFNVRAVVLSDETLPLLRVTCPEPSAVPLPTCAEPVRIVVPAEYALFPESVTVPVPTLVSASEPPLLMIVPVNVLDALLLPTVKMLAPELTSTVPLPLRPLIVSLEPAR